MAGLIPLGQMEVASDLTTQALVKFNTLTRAEIDARVQSVAAGIIAADPAIAAAAEAAVDEALATATTAEAFAPRPAVGPLASNRSAVKGVDHPTLTPYASNPIDDLAGAHNMYYAQVIHVAEFLTSPLDNYYRWDSSDHGTDTDARIRFSTGPTRYGPWTAQTEIITPATLGAGNQPETPRVIWNEKTNLFHLFFHVNVVNAGSVQHTKVWTTPTGYDGFVDTGERLVFPVQTFLGDGHTGYFQPFRIGPRWYGISLASSSTPLLYALWSSPDGIKWRVDPRLLTGLIADAGLLIPGPNAGTSELRHIFQWRGNPWMLCTVRDPVGGANYVLPPQKWCVAQLTPNLRNLVGGFFDITPPVESYYTGEDLAVISMLEDNGRLYFYAEPDSSKLAIFEMGA